MIIHYACSGKLKSGLIITYAASVCHAERPFLLADIHVIWFDFRDAKLWRVELYPMSTIYVLTREKYTNGPTFGVLMRL